MSAKEYKFLSTVKIANDVATKYPNYKINGFTPKTLAKRLISDNSEKGSMRDFGFEYKIIPLNPIQKLFVVQEVVVFGDEVRNITVLFDKRIAEDYTLTYSKKVYKGVCNSRGEEIHFDKCTSYDEIYELALANQDSLEFMVKLNELNIASKELYHG